MIRISTQVQAVTMATLNLSTNGPSISKSYQSIINAPPPTGNASKSATYGQWAIFSVSAPLANAFQQDAGGKESVLKVQSTGGESLDRGYEHARKLNGCRGRASRPHRRVFRWQNPICICQSKGSQYYTTEVCPHWLVWRGRA